MVKDVSEALVESPDSSDIAEDDNMGKCKSVCVWEVFNISGNRPLWSNQMKQVNWR